MLFPLRDELEHGRQFWDDLLERDDGEDDWDTDLEDENEDDSPAAAPPNPNTSGAAQSVHTHDETSGDEAEVDEDSDSSSNEIAAKVKLVLARITEVGLTLPQFLLALSWGDSGCTADPHIRGARTSLMNSNELPMILHHWWKPPRSTMSRKSRTRAARSVMADFAQTCLRETLDCELDAVSAVLRTPDDVSEEFYTSTKFETLANQIAEIAPMLWSMLRHSAYTRKQEKKNTRKNPTKIIVIIVAMLSYTRNHHANLLQKLLAIFLKFRGLSAKAFDTLHALAITMSHKWTANHVAKLSAAAMKEVIELMDLYPWLVSYDNINIPFRVFSQRLDNKDTFSSGVAATVYIKRQAQHLTADVNKFLKEYRHQGMENAITPLEIFRIGQSSYPLIYHQAQFEVLRFLFNTPEFDFKTYSNRADPLLNPPSGHILPHGPHHITQQYLLGSVNIPEQSYADNERVVEEILRQLELGGSAEKEHQLGMEKVVAWAGDQLTVERLRGIFKYRSQDINSFDRFDWVILVFGWFHLQMAFANSLHKQYLGTSKGQGLLHAFTLLGRKGLGTVMTQGPFHHHLEEVLYHVAEAHVRATWLVVSGAKDLAELRTRSANELVALAKKLVDEHASSEALEQLRALPEDEHDEVKYLTIQWTRDVLHYIVLDKAIKHGDVGLMEAMLPTLLYRFAGGGNTKYTIEVLELLQGLHKEWPPTICDFVRKHCWLVNFEGRRNTFLPIDMAQEHNIKDIKVTYRSEGPNAQWDYFKKLHPALRTIRQLGKHMEEEFNTLTRGSKHGDPKKDADVKLLQAAYEKTKLHHYIPGRTVFGGKRDKATDFITAGAIKVQTTSTIETWAESRNFVRSRKEDYGQMAVVSEPI